MSATKAKADVAGLTTPLAAKVSSAISNSIASGVADAAESAFNSLAGQVAEKAQQAQQEQRGEIASLNAPKASQLKATADEALAKLVPETTAAVAAGTRPDEVRTAEEQRASDLAPHIDSSGNWLLADGSVIGADANGDGKFSSDEVDEAAYNELVDSYMDDERSILRDGVSTSGVSSWDDAVAAGLVSKADAEKGRASGQTYLDTRFGDAYRVKRADGSTGDSLRDLYSGDDFTDYLVEDGYAFDRYELTARRNAERRAANDLRLLSDAVGGAGESYGDSAFFSPQAGSYLLDMYSQDVQDGTRTAANGNGAFSERFRADSGEWDPREESWASYLKRGMGDFARRNGGEGLRGWLASSSAVGGTNPDSPLSGTVVSDLLGLANGALQDAGGAIRNLGNTDLSENVLGYDADLVNRELSEYVAANRDQPGLVTEKPKGDAIGVESVTMADPETGEELFTWDASNFTGSLLDADGYDWDSMTYTWPNGRRSPLVENGSGYVPAVSMSTAYGDDAIAWQPYTAVEGGQVDPVLLQSLSSGGRARQVADGLKDSYQDILSEDGLDYSEMLKHPVQSAKWLADMGLTSIPYMLPGIGKASVVSDTLMQGQGLDSMGYNPTAKTYSDPGLKSNDVHGGEVAETGLEGAFEGVTGIAGGRVAGSLGEAAWNDLLRPAWRKGLDKVLPRDYGQAVARAAGETPLKAAAGKTARTGLEEGLEESATSFFQEYFSPQGIGGEHAVGEDGEWETTPWGEDVYEEAPGFLTRAGNFGKTALDSFVGGGALGLGIGAATSGAPAYRAAKARRSGELPVTLEGMRYQRNHLTDEDLGDLAHLRR